MKHPRQIVEQEPFGIVVADGSRGEVTPRFFAYVWAAAPEPMPLDVVSEPKAA